MRAAGTWLSLCATVVAGMGVIVFAPEAIFGFILMAVVIALAFISGFCRGWWVNEHAWRTKAEKIGAALWREGVPVSITPGDVTFRSSPPGGQHTPFERQL